MRLQRRGGGGVVSRWEDTSTDSFPICGVLLSSTRQFWVCKREIMDNHNKVMTPGWKNIGLDNSNRMQSKL